MEDMQMSTLASIKALMGDQFPTLIEHFLYDIQEQLQQLKQAIQDNDFEQLQFLSHKMAGSCINLGCIKVHTLCKGIENAPTQQRATIAEETFNALESAINAVKPILVQYGKPA